ncbi:DUF2634 domain-containing protein [Paenibacillus sp. FA6]|uniref:DUF2634 domain-containing protein n=1 Tax=Paenibacillus sp. FA6 TaxID=3413029 RepID=UPI003F65CC26
MIPLINDDLEADFEIEAQSTKTYKLNIDADRIIGFIDEIEALKQSIFLMLSIERYDYLIYPWDYGVELKDLFGKPTNFVLPEIKRRISEALTQDERIESVDAFSFDVKRGKVHVVFTVHSIYGNFESEKEVSI